MSYILLFFELVWGMVVGLVAATEPFVLLPVVALLVILRFLRAGLLTRTLCLWIALYVILSQGFKVSLPKSVVTIYMTIVTAALLAYISSSRERWESFSKPILRLVLDPGRRVALISIVALLPIVAAFNVYRGMQFPLEAPSFARTVHPAPPEMITNLQLYPILGCGSIG